MIWLIWLILNLRDRIENFAECRSARFQLESTSLRSLSEFTSFYILIRLQCEYKEDVPACGSKHLPESYDAKAKIATGTAPTTAFPVK